MAVGMSPVHWQLVRLSAVPVLVKLPRLCCSHGLYTGFSAMGSSAGRFPLPCVLVPSLRILWLESPRVTGCVWSREKPVGPMVLLPRVGQPKRSKVAKYPDPDVFMLSDCVIALMCHNSESAELLWKDLQSNWSLLEQEYVGSGARYITNHRLSGLLSRLGYFPLVGSSNDRNSVKGEQRNGRGQNQSAQ